MKTAILFSEHPSSDLDLFIQLQGLRGILKKNSIFVGPIPAWDDPRAFRVALSHYDVVLFTGLDAEERKGFLEQASPLGIPCIPFGCVPATFCSFTPFDNFQPSPVFFPGEFDDQDINLRQRKLFQLLDRRAPTLWVSQTLQAFQQSPTFGVRALYAPKAPQLHLEAIGLASQVISARLTPAVLAASKGIPSLLVSFSDEMTKVAETFGIPVLSMGKRKNSARLLSEINTVFSNYPWPQVTQNITQEVTHLKALLETSRLELSPTNAPKKKPYEPTGNPILLTAIATTETLPQLEGMVANILLQTEKEVRFFLLTDEPAIEERLRSRFKKVDFQFLIPQNLWSQEELALLKSKSLSLILLASKARFLKEVLKTTRSQIFYCDTQTYFYSSVSALLKTTGLEAVTLYPCWRDEFRDSRRFGLFDAGFLALKPGSERFLNWWGDETNFCVLNAEERAAVYHQGILDFAPVYFSEVGIYRRGDLSIAPWNTQSLGVHLREVFDPIPRLANEAPIHTFKAVGQDTEGIFETKCAWDQLVTFFGPDNRGTPTLITSLWALQKHYSSDLRRLFKVSEKLGNFPLSSPNPFNRMRVLSTTLANFLGGGFRFWDKVQHLFGLGAVQTSKNLWHEVPPPPRGSWSEKQHQVFLSQMEEAPEGDTQDFQRAS